MVREEVREREVGKRRKRQENALKGKILSRENVGLDARKKPDEVKREKE